MATAGMRVTEDSLRQPGYPLSSPRTRGPNHQPLWLKKRAAAVAGLKSHLHGVWVPAFAGTTLQISLIRRVT